MANALQRFGERILQLSTQSEILRKESASIMERIHELERRQAEINEELVSLQLQSTALAQSYLTDEASHTPAKHHNRSSLPVSSQHVPIAGLDKQSIGRTEATSPSPPINTKPSSPPSDTRGTRSGGSGDEIVVASKRTPPATTDHPIIHKKYPTVILLHGNWTEIWCGECGGNSNQRHRIAGVFHGLHGLHHHWVNAHKAQFVDRSRSMCLLTCGRRVVSSADVELMRQGREPQDVKIAARFGRAISTPLLRDSVMSTPGGPASHAQETNSAVAWTLPTSSGDHQVHVSREQVASREKLTEYEAYQNIMAHAAAQDTPPKKRRRTTTKTAQAPSDDASSMDEVDYGDHVAS